jgi:lysophospholipase L1-like esterase
MKTEVVTAPPRVFRPLTLLLGVLLGFIALAWAGRTVTRESWYRDFARFHPLISPDSHYQPTVAEMCAIVRAQCRADQVLVVVGGNSIFQGVGQPVEKLWTRRLQELLGDGYAVVNLAFRGSSPTDGGALVAEALRREFPRQIYLANVPPFTAASPIGSIDYRFMLFDAHYKGLLIRNADRDAAIADYLAHPDRYPAAREQSLAGRADAWLHFRALWNWFSSTRVFTFPTPLTQDLNRAFQPRQAFVDREPDFETIPWAERFPARSLAKEMEITRNTSIKYYNPTADGGWALIDFEQQQFRNFALAAFPERLRTRTLIVVSRNSPYYVRQLSATEQVRDDLAYRDTVAAWRALGFPATEYGADFSPEDFGDRTHLTASGGRKLAEIVAPEIRRVASQLGFTKL